MKSQQLPWYGYCHYCGKSLKGATPSSEGPRCNNCGNITFLNSVAVAVLIAPCHNHSSGRKNGVFIQKRGISPNMGEWALPSGYVMAGETWEAAACREASEEINIHCRLEHSKFENPQLVLLGTSTNRKQTIVVGSVDSVYRVGEFTPNREVLERDVIFPDDKRQLCFPIHRQALALYWSRRNVSHNIAA